jgi:hypothetical protein
MPPQKNEWFQNPHRHQTIWLVNGKRAEHPGNNPEELWTVFRRKGTSGDFIEVDGTATTREILERNAHAAEFMHSRILDDENITSQILRLNHAIILSLGKSQDKRPCINTAVDQLLELLNNSETEEETKKNGSSTTSHFFKTLIPYHTIITEEKTFRDLCILREKDLWETLEFEAERELLPELLLRITKTRGLKNLTPKLSKYIAEML